LSFSLRFFSPICNLVSRKDAKSQSFRDAEIWFVGCAIIIKNLKKNYYIILVLRLCDFARDKKEKNKNGREIKEEIWQKTK
jgi:hypothetical protein